jgi:Na+/H+ antiporter NhaD/arsenite permease-like protein
VAPFVLLLVCIAVLPLAPKVSHLWEHNAVKAALALGLGVPVAVVIAFSGEAELVEESIAEYVQFIVLLGSLFVASGGIHLAGDLRATPRNNTIILALGGVLASFIGTTGAAMLLIRPLLSTNSEREKRSHTIVFAILVVANCGGLLTPLGDPPLYIGLMRGVPFTWTFSLILQWMFVNGLLLLTYYGLDRRMYRREGEFALAWDAESAKPIRVHGALNILWLAVIIASVALLGEWPLINVVVQIADAAASFFLTNPQVRFDENEFTWSPIIEVAALFAGIFMTMIPALGFLREHANELPLNEYTLFGFTGVLSSVLDNAPTYLTFFEMSTQLSVPGAAVVAGVPEPYLVAISLGAVTCGAMTYIGNGPNFMVKAVAEEAQVEMPSFGGYILWTLNYLVPVLVAMVLIFLSHDPLIQAAGWALAALVAGRAVFWIVRNPTPKTPIESEVSI